MGSRLQGLIYFKHLGDILAVLFSESVLRDNLKVMRAVNYIRSLLSRWVVRGQEPKLMVNQVGGSESRASLGKYTVIP